MSFRNRLLITFAAVLIVNTVLLLTITLRVARGAFGAQSRVAVTAALASADAQLASVMGRVRAALARLAEDNAFVSILDGALTGSWPAESHAVVSAADRFRPEECDVLRALAPGGIVLSSSPDREIFGSLDRERAALASIGEVGPDLDLFDIAGVATPVVYALRRLPSGVVLVAGRVLDEKLAAELSRSAGAPTFFGVEGRWISTEDVRSLPLELTAADTTRQGEITVVRARNRSTAMTRKVGNKLTLLVTQDETALARLQGALTRLAIGVGVVTLLLSWLLAFPVARGVTRPIRDLALATDRVAAGNWDEPVEVASGAPEFRKLQDAFNAMLKELMREREALARAERVAAWRDAAQRVAHEIRNALSPLQLTWERLSAAAERDPGEGVAVVRESAESITREFTTLRRIVGEFSELARWPEPVLSEIDVSEQVKATAALYAGDTDRRVTVKTGGPMTIRADAGQVSRAVANLIQNALEATEPGGLVEVGTYEDDGTVVVEVRDDGQGMDDETARRIFTPYFTTRDGGTGLGLSIVERVMEAHGGEVRVITAPGQGTTMSLRFRRG